MNDQFQFFQDPNGKYHLVRRKEDYIDFYQAYVDKTDREQKFKIPMEEISPGGYLFAKKANKLIHEYSKTAARVGASLSSNHLRKILHALVEIGSQGERKPLGIISRKDPRAQFLAESLFSELLEIPSKFSGHPPFSKDWKACLKLLSGSLTSNSTLSSPDAN